MTVVTVVIVVTKIMKPLNSSDSCDNNHETSQQKNHITSFFSIFEKSILTHWTTDMMFSGQRFAILAMFFGEVA